MASSNSLTSTTSAPTFWSRSVAAGARVKVAEMWDPIGRPPPEWLAGRGRCRRAG